MEEVNEGVLIGPLTSAEVEGLAGKLWTGARRFGIEQSGKVRPIHDFSEFHINQSFGTSEKIDLMSLDQV
eukprot:6477232-Karenia_brevis.AAC.1